MTKYEEILTNNLFLAIIAVLTIGGFFMIQSNHRVDRNPDETHETGSNLNEKAFKASWYSLASLEAEGTLKTSSGVMANGEMFDENALTCATRDYPLNTTLKITNKTTGKSVVAKVTDRTNKRFKGIRIDLSKEAFSRIADLKDGLCDVMVEVR